MVWLVVLALLAFKGLVMKAIAKVSIGNFLPDDELKGLSDERIAELVDAGFAEYAEESDEDLQAQAEAEASRLKEQAEAQQILKDAEETRLQAEAEAEQKRLADEADAADVPEPTPEPKKPSKKV